MAAAGCARPVRASRAWLHCRYMLILPCRVSLHHNNRCCPLAQGVSGAAIHGLDHAATQLRQTAGRFPLPQTASFPSIWHHAAGLVPPLQGELQHPAQEQPALPDQVLRQEASDASSDDARWQRDAKAALAEEQLRKPEQRTRGEGQEQHNAEQPQAYLHAPGQELAHAKMPQPQQQQFALLTQQQAQQQQRQVQLMKQLQHAQHELAQLMEADSSVIPATFGQSPSTATTGLQTARVLPGMLVRMLTAAVPPNAILSGTCDGQ